MKQPFDLSVGIEYSKRCFNGATARDVTMSYFSLLILAYSSALALITFIFFNSNLSITCCKNKHFLLVESNKSIFKLGNTIFKTNPGNPAPVPISNRYWLSKCIIFMIHNES